MTSSKACVYKQKKDSLKGNNFSTSHILLISTCFAGMTFTVAPESICSLMGVLLRSTSFGVEGPC